MIQGRYVTNVELEKPVSGGLGFSVVGLKSENRGELGIFIQEIQPGSVAHWYVRINMPSIQESTDRLQKWFKCYDSKVPESFFF